MAKCSGSEGAFIRKNVLTIISIGLFLISLTQNAFYTADDPNAWSPGWALLAFGWLGACMGGGAAITWAANPFLVFSWLMQFTKQERLSAILGLIAALIAASFLLFSKVISSEAPTYSNIVGYDLGYWLWLTSCVLMALPCVMYLNRWQNPKEFALPE